MRKALAKQVSRLLSGITALFMTLSCFGGALLEPLYANAADVIKVTVEGIDMEGNKIEGGLPEETLQDGTKVGRVYILAWYEELPAPETPTVSGPVVGWKLVEITDTKPGPQQYYFKLPASADFDPDTFFAYGTGNNAGRTKDPISPEDKYDPEKHVFKFRVYRTNGKYDTADQPANFAECSSKCSDSFPGYIPSVEGTTLTLTRQDISFNLDYTFESPTTVSASDNYYVVVDVLHQSWQRTYYYEKVSFNNQTADKSVSVQTDKTSKWYNDQGQQIGSERFNGGEQSVEVYLVKASADATVNDILTRREGKVEVVNNGCVANNQVINYTDLSCKQNKNHYVYSVGVNFGKQTSEPVEGHNYQSILGDGLYYGFVANVYRKASHTETNLAVNYYGGKGNADGDLSGNFGGHFYIPNYVTFTGEDPLDFTYIPETEEQKNDPDKRLKIDIGTACCPEGVVLHTDMYGRLLYEGDPKYSHVAIVVENPAVDMTNNVINPIIKSMQNMSAQLAKQPVNFSYQLKNQGKTVVIDTRDLADNATVYIDGDAITKQLAMTGSEGDNGDGLKIKIKKGQTVVFNFDKEKDITLAKYGIEIYESDGVTPIPEKAYATKGCSTEPESYKNSNDNNQNTWLDQVSRSIVWNLRSAEKVTIESSAGIFLVPSSTSKTEVATSSTGWIVTAGYITNTGGEWHFVYNGVPGTTSKVSFEKTDMEGERINGAMFEVRDANNAIVRKWTVGKDEITNPTTFAFAPGEYTLNEVGIDTELTGGVDYAIIPTSFKFKVVQDEEKDENGVMTSHVEVDASQEACEQNQQGYYKYNANSATAVALNGEKSKGAKITIEKFDYSGNKLDGAEFKIYEVSGTTEQLVAILKPTDKAAAEYELPEGSYKLVETKAPEGCQVIADPVNFTVVKNTFPNFNWGAYYTVTGDDNSLGLVDNNKGYYKAEVANEPYSFNQKLTVSAYDAEEQEERFDVTFSKTDLGGNEIEGAEVKVSVKDGDLIDSWTSGEDGRDNSGKIKPHTIEGTFVPGVVYVYEETTAPAGYAVTEKVYFKLDDEGSVLVSSDGSSFSAVNTPGTVVLVDAPIEFTVVKTDLDGTQIGDGVVFSIRRTDGTPVRENLTVNGSRTFSCVEEGIEPGTYILREEMAPANYNTADDIEFTINEDGTVSDADGNKLADNTIVVKDSMYTTVSVSKKDVAGTEEIAGAHLQILDSNRKEVYDALDSDVLLSWDSSADGAKNFVLKDGVYILVETPDTGADGFFTNSDGRKFKVTASELTFEVKNGQIVETDGAKTEFDDKSEDSYYVVKGNTVYVSDAEIFAPAEITFTKTDITGKNEVSGASLAVYTDSSCTKLAKDTGGNNVSWTSDEDEHSFVLKDGTYYLKETGTNEFYDELTQKWYTVIESTMQFVIEKGKVKSVTGAEEAVKTDTASETAGYFVGKAGSSTFIICDAEAPEKTVEVSFSKKNITGLEEVHGAKLAVYTDSECKTLAKDVQGNTLSWTSDGNAKKFTLKNGTYYLKETGDAEFYDEVTDKYYTIVESVMTFVVKDGAVYSVTGAERSIIADATPDMAGYFVGQAKSSEFIICDAEAPAKTLEVSISKKDIANEKEVKGASLKIYTDAGFSELAKDVTGADAVWTSNGEEWKLTLSDGTYYLVEEAAEGSDGTFVAEDGITYKITPSFLKFVIKNGQVDEVSGAAASVNKQSAESYFLADKENAKFTVCDAVRPDIAATVKLEKIRSTDGAHLVGGLFVFRNEEGQEVASWVPNENDNPFKELTLTKGTYTITEEKAPSGYEKISGSVTFTVDADGNVTVDPEQEVLTTNAASKFIYDSENIKFTAVDDFDRYSVTVCKTDGNNLLAGAELKITKSNGDVIESSYTTSAAAAWNITEKFIMNEVYTLTEVNAPSGYVLADPIHFKFDFDGVLYVKAAGSSEFVAQRGTTIEMIDTETLVTISKTDMAGEEIAGAELEVVSVAADGTETSVDSWTSVKGESHEIIGLEAGAVYKLTEEQAPAKYDIAESIYFKVDENNNVTVSSSATGSFTAVENATVVMKDAMFTDVTISKKSITTEQELGGAQLVIYEENGTTVAKDTENHELSWTSDKDSAKTFTLKNGTYILEETGDEFTGSDGKTYKVVTSKTKFTVENGKITSSEIIKDATSDDDNGTIEVDKDNNKITISDAEAESGETGGDDEGGDDKPHDGGDDEQGDDKPHGGDDGQPSGGDDDSNTGDDEEGGNGGRQTGGEDEDGEDGEGGGKKAGGDDEDGDGGNTPNTGAGAGFAAAFMIVGAAVVIFGKKKNG